MEDNAKERIDLLERQVENLKKLVLLKDKYMELVVDLLFDYDGYYSRETKTGNIHDLADLIDEAAGFLKNGLANEDYQEAVYGIVKDEDGFDQIYLKGEIGYGRKNCRIRKTNYRAERKNYRARRERRK